jgi:hypothetical protein
MGLAKRVHHAIQAQTELAPRIFARLSTVAQAQTNALLDFRGLSRTFHARLAVFRLAIAFSVPDAKVLHLGEASCFDTFCTLPA